MSPVDYLIDTSALARILVDQEDSFGWGNALEAGTVGICQYTELEFLYSARSAADRAAKVDALHALLPQVIASERVADRAWFVQKELTAQGLHRGPGPVDLLVAATAELHGLPVLHQDNDFDTIAGVTGQPMRRLVQKPGRP